MIIIMWLIQRQCRIQNLLSHFFLNKNSCCFDTYVVKYSATVSQGECWSGGLEGNEKKLILSLFTSLQPTLILWYSGWLLIINCVYIKTARILFRIENNYYGFKILNYRYSQKTFRVHEKCQLCKKSSHSKVFHNYNGMWHSKIHNWCQSCHFVI